MMRISFIILIELISSQSESHPKNQISIIDVLSENNFSSPKSSVNQNIQFFIYSNGEVIVRGEDEMNNSSATNSLFSQYRNFVRILDIDDKITSIGSFSFEGCHQLKMATIGLQVGIIHESAFANCINLSSIIFRNKSTMCSTNLFLKPNLSKIENFQICQELFQCCIKR